VAIIVGSVHHASNAALRFVNACDGLLGGLLTIIHHYERHHFAPIVVLSCEANLSRQHFLSALDCIKLPILPIKPRHHDVVHALYWIALEQVLELYRLMQGTAHLKYRNLRLREVGSYDMS